ncbi:MAG: aldo/keto reductase [Porphyromonadaceae bacterium]|nr:MAG: aldo/keto reductase [Porphyromonadaceae bacterium]
MAKINLTRRQFVTAITLGAGTVLLDKSVFALPTNLSGLSTDPFQVVKLGKSGLKTTLLGMGTGFSGYNRSSNITRAGVAESLIRQAYEKGIRFFDCADSYGTHPSAAAALKGFPRENYLLSSKIWVGQGGIPEPERPDADVVVERFRKELNTDYLDLVQIHCMTDAHWTDQQKKQMDILENLKAKKIIRAHGVSVHSLEAMKACVESPWVDVVHVRVNPFGEAMDNKDPAEVIPVIEKLHKAGKGVIGMKLIGNGKFRNDSDKIDESLKYVLGLGTVDVIIVGFELPEQIDNYIGRVKNALRSK